MKKLIFVVIAVVLTVGMLAISGCGKKKQPDVQTMVASDVTSSSATLSGMLVDDGNDRIASLGFYYSTDREMGNKQTAICNDYDGSESYSVTISNLQSNTTYYYQSYAENGKGVGVGRVMTFATSIFSSGGSSGGSQGGGTPTPSPTPTPGQLNGHAYVDLGLPSGTLWATCNVGAETPEGYGNYYAWGETTPKEIYNWSTYRYYDGSSIIKYTTIDNLTTLESSDDAATVNWGVGWRTPTSIEFEELIYNCSHEWINQNGMYGRLFTGANGNSIFLPAADDQNDKNINRAIPGGVYWSSSIYNDGYGWCAWYLIFHSDYCYMNNSYTIDRSSGLSIRPVCSSNTPSVQSYTVTFNANGGTGYMQPQTFRQGVSQALSANSFYRDGYTFSGWNTAANGNGVSYSNRQTITVNSNMTLYAQWTANGGSQGSGQLNGHAYVDLGLPSGTKWATCNVGATTPEGYGNYYAWGETTPKDIYTWTNYRFRTSGDSNDNVQFSKYNTSSSYGPVDDLTILEASDDAATANWGTGWRIPTYEEIAELKNHCTLTWTTQNDVNGYLFTGPNGNSIFLPAAGDRRDGSLFIAGSYGYYWSSSLYSSNTYRAWSLFFSSSDCLMNYCYRYDGLSVRAVCNQ